MISSLHGLQAVRPCRSCGGILSDRSTVTANIGSMKVLSVDTITDAGHWLDLRDRDSARTLLVFSSVLFQCILAPEISDNVCVLGRLTQTIIPNSCTLNIILYIIELSFSSLHCTLLH